jgi:hypothetical protein
VSSYSFYDPPSQTPQQLGLEALNTGMALPSRSSTALGRCSQPFTRSSQVHLAPRQLQCVTVSRPLKVAVIQCPVLHSSWVIPARSLFSGGEYVCRFNLAPDPHEKHAWIPCLIVECSPAWFTQCSARSQMISMLVCNSLSPYPLMIVLPALSQS